MMMTEERYIQTGYYNEGMTYEEYKKCYCPDCPHKDDCRHREAYRRYPEKVGGLGLCLNLKK